MILERAKIQNSSWFEWIGLIGASICIAYLLASLGILAGVMVMGLLFAIVTLIAVVNNFRIGFYLLLIIGIFMFFIDRLLSLPLPLGVVYDCIIVLSFASLFFTPKRNLVDWSELKNPTTFLLILFIIYQLLQAFNPNAVSLEGWLVSLRVHSSFLLYVVSFHFVRSFHDVKVFTKVWLALGLIIALYGIYQEFFGLSPFEWRWIYASPNRLSLYYVAGHLRKFSILSDASSFGLFMAFSGITCIILSLGPIKLFWKIVLLGMAMIMFISMSFSGTRTAYAIVPIGAVFYVLMTLRNRKTLLVMAAGVLVAMFVMFAPVYNNRTINRIRSTFRPDDDASMGVRDEKRLRLQPYIQTHPIGGGPNTTGRNGLRYAPNHELAGGWDPDSGYLGTALELGWIGLILLIAFFFYVCLKGINSYFSLQDPMNKVYLLAYLVPFFALSVAHYTQHAMFQRSILIIVIATYTLMERIKKFEADPETQILNKT